MKNIYKVITVTLTRSMGCFWIFLRWKNDTSARSNHSNEKATPTRSIHKDTNAKTGSFFGPFEDGECFLQDMVAETLHLVGKRSLRILWMSP